MGIAEIKTELLLLTVLTSNIALYPLSGRWSGSSLVGKSITESLCLAPVVPNSAESLRTGHKAVREGSGMFMLKH
jgi:hypothetical protein